MKTWSQISAELNLALLNEGDIHPHVSEERAHLFHSHDNGATEFEWLNLINAFVMATKPTLCIETGTYTGLGTIAIAAALEWNNHGRLITLDIDECETAKKLIAGYDLSGRVDFVKSDARKFISDWYGLKFNFAFIDSGGERLQETNLLHARGLMSSGAPIILHDASLLRNPGETVGSQFERECSIKGHTISLSRGIRIMFA